MNKYCKILNKAWLNSLLMIIFATAAAVIYVWKFATESMLSGNEMNYYPFAAMAVMILCLIMGNNSTAKKIKKLRQEELKDKLAKYKIVYEKRLKWFCGISLVAVLSMVMIASLFYVIFALLSLVLVIISRAYSYKVKFELNLAEEDLKRMDKMKFA